MSPLQASPAIAVIMPCYNLEAHWLRQAIASLRQNQRSYRVILVDDGSRRKPPELIPELMDELYYIPLVQNSGVSHARNVGIQTALAIGVDYIAMLDGDDYAALGRLDRQCDFLDAHTAIGAVGSWTVFVDMDGAEIYRFTPPIDDQAIRNYLYRNNPLHQSSLMFRRQALAGQAYDETINNAEDYDLIWRLAPHWQFANLPDYLTFYRVNPNGLSQVRRYEQLLARLKIQCRHFTLATPRSAWGIVRTLLILAMPAAITRILKGWRMAGASQGKAEFQS